MTSSTTEYKESVNSPYSTISTKSTIAYNDGHAFKTVITTEYPTILQMLPL